MPLYHLPDFLSDICLRLKGTNYEVSTYLCKINSLQVCMYVILKVFTLQCNSNNEEQVLGSIQFTFYHCLSITIQIYHIKNEHI